MTCAKTGSADAVRMLIEYGAAVNAKEPEEDQTALMWAAAERHPDVVKALIDAHADLKAHTKTGIHRDPLCGARRRHGKHPGVAGRRSGREPPDPGGGQNEPRHDLSWAIAKTARTHSATLPCWWRSCGARWTTALWLLDHGADPNN